NHQRHPVLRTGAHQRRDLVYSVGRQSARRSRVQTNGEVVAGHWKPERGNSLERLGQIVERARRDHVVERTLADNEREREIEKAFVKLSTVHQAKGLEFHTVFVIWLTDGMFPSSRSMDERKDLEEERRLFYVAITRAKDELYLTYPHMRLTGGYGDVFQRPSRFLKEIPNKLVEDWQVQRG